MPTSLYRYFCKRDRLLYVGVSVSPFMREKQHRADKDMTQVRYIELEWFDTDAEAYAAEKLAIKRERPSWNIAGQRKVRQVRVTQFPPARIEPKIAANNTPDGVPILRQASGGYRFGCGGSTPDAVPDRRVFPADENGRARVVKVMRAGDFLFTGPDAEMSKQNIDDMLFGGIFHCSMQ